MLAVRERVQAHRLSTCSRLRGSGVAMWWAPRPPVQMNFTRRGGHTHTATEAQATAHYRPQRTAHRREASGEGFTIRRASRVGGTPPPNSNACACSLCAWCASCRAAQKSRMGAFSQLRWVSTEVGFKVRRTSRDWVGRELRAPLTPPATSHPIGHVPSPRLRSASTVSAAAIHGWAGLLLAHQAKGCPVVAQAVQDYRPQFEDSPL